jgi:tellurite resistance protein
MICVKALNAAICLLLGLHDLEGQMAEARKRIPASFFGMILGLAGMGQAWRSASTFWGTPPWIAEAILLLASLIWATLLVRFVAQTVFHPREALREAQHPVLGGTPVLLAIATLLIALAALPYSRALTGVLATFGIGGHLGFSLWQTGAIWRGGRSDLDTLPTVYLPTVAGNFTSGGVLGALGHSDWGWLFLGAGLFSWLALESLMIRRVLIEMPLPATQRPLLGIQFAPPVVCAMAGLLLVPDSHDYWLLMLLGYGLFQLVLGMRLFRWLGEGGFSMSYWSYTFGVAATTICCLKLALNGVGAARALSLPVFVLANLFVGYLSVRTARLWFAGRLLPQTV